MCVLNEFTGWTELSFHQQLAQKTERGTWLSSLSHSCYLTLILPLSQKSWVPKERLGRSKPSLAGTFPSWFAVQQPPSCHYRHDCFIRVKMLKAPKPTQLSSCLVCGECPYTSVLPGYFVDSSNSIRVRSNHSLEKLITFFVTAIDSHSDILLFLTILLFHHWHLIRTSDRNIIGLFSIFFAQWIAHFLHLILCNVMLAILFIFILI